MRSQALGVVWQNLTANEKEPYEQQAASAKKKFTIEWVEYIQTESYKAYSAYLEDFKAKQLHIQESSQEVIAPDEISKMPKLKKIPSANSTSPTKLNTAASLSRRASSGMRARGPSLDSIQRPWFQASLRCKPR